MGNSRFLANDSLMKVVSHAVSKMTLHLKLLPVAVLVALVNAVIHMTLLEYFMACKVELEISAF